MWVPHSVLELLIGAGADVNVEATFGFHDETPLHVASRMGLTHNVAALLAAGADVNAIPRASGSPVDLAAVYHQRRVIPMLLRAGSKLNFFGNDFGNMPNYRRKIDRAGGFKQYEAQVKKSLAALLVPKFPQIPAEVIPTVVEFWAHAGDY